MDEPIICTIISKSYLPQARVLAKSFLSSHPGGRCYVLVVDELEGHFEPKDQPFEVVRLADLQIPELTSFKFKYGVVELCTAVKPYLLTFLLTTRKCTKVAYLDPDILILAPLSDLFGRLDDHEILLTPHVDKDYPDDGLTPDDSTLLRYGAFNLGFIGVRSSCNALAFLEWWQKKLFDKCLAAPEAGYFVDQRFVDIALSLFPGFGIVRDPGYNVAWWNLHARRVTRSAADWLCNDGPLHFFHFSGFRPGDVELTRYPQTRCHLNDLPDLRVLCGEYSHLLVANGYEQARTWPYSYDYFLSGARINREARIRYRKLVREGRAPGDPFRSRSLQWVSFRSRVLRRITRPVRHWRTWLRGRRGTAPGPSRP